MAQTEKYYLIRSTEDGLSIHEHTAHSLQAAIKDATDDVKPECHWEFVDKIPGSLGGDWRSDNQVVLIKGKIIVPEPIQVVTEYRLE